MSGDLQVRLVDEPAVPGGMQAGPGCIDQLRGEPLHPPVDRHVIHDNATLGEQLFYLAVGQAVPQIPAHRQADHFRREPETSERRH